MSTPTPDLSSDATSRGAALGSAAAVWAVTLLLAAGHIVLQGRVAGPWLVDELAYLRGADTMTGGSPTLLHGVPYYRWGYSVLLVPLEALPLDRPTHFKAITVLNAVLLAAVYPVVRILLRRITEATPAQAALGALMAALLPVIWVYGGFAMSEVLLVLLVPLWLLAVHRSASAGRPAPLLLVWTLALYATHTRMVVVLLPTAWLLIDLARQREARRAVALWTAGLGAGIIMVHLVDRWMKAVRWSVVATPESSDGGPLGLLVHPSRWDDLAAFTLGHSWQLVVSGGVPLIAVLVAIAQRVRTPGGRAARDAAATTVRSAVVLLAALTAASIGFLTVAATRADHLVYGRYAEIALAPIVGIGVVGILRSGPLGGLAARITMGAAVVLGALLAFLPWTERLRTERVPVLHAPSLTILTSGDGSLAIWRVTAVTAALAALVAASASFRRAERRREVAIGLLVVWIVAVCALDVARAAVKLTESRRDHARAYVIRQGKW